MFLGNLSYVCCQIACKLQAWDMMMSRFVDYGVIDVSEHYATSVRLPAVVTANRTHLLTSHTWRILICQPFNAPPPTTNSSDR